MLVALSENQYYQEIVSTMKTFDFFLSVYQSQGSVLLKENIGNLSSALYECSSCGRIWHTVATLNKGLKPQVLSMQYLFSKIPIQKPKSAVSIGKYLSN